MAICDVLPWTWPFKSEKSRNFTAAMKVSTCFVRPKLKQVRKDLAGGQQCLMFTRNGSFLFIKTHVFVVFMRTGKWQRIRFLWQTRFFGHQLFRLQIHQIFWASGRSQGHGRTPRGRHVSWLRSPKASR